MAKAKLSKLIKSLHGEIDGLCLREMPESSIVVSKVPTHSGGGRVGAFREA